MGNRQQLIDHSLDKTFEIGPVIFNMVFVEGGSFMMGAQKTNPSGVNYDQEALEHEGPVHEVTLKDYYLAETETTQALWHSVMGTPMNQQTNGQLPVVNVSWFDCQKFIKTLNDKTGCRFRLPTEAEWEYAARGGRYSHGYRYSGSDDICRVAWCNEIALDGGTHVVKAKAANELDLYDMSGNVWEWCEDIYRDNAYKRMGAGRSRGPLFGSFSSIYDKWSEKTT